MFEEGQLYSPVTARDGEVEVHLAADHPGVDDPGYRRRRNEIAAAALAWEVGTPAPEIVYAEAEQDVWRTVCRELAPKHEALACRAFREAKARLALPADRIPQLEEVSGALAPLTGWRYAPAAGLVALREFYEALGSRTFHSTQYIRHPAAPLYTPEPDLVHEVLGHGNLLADAQFAELKRLAGRAADRVESDAALKLIADVFWFTLEFGLLWEDGELRCYGAGLLSSFGEIDEFRGADVRPLDVRAMGTLEYDIAHYQPILFAAESMDQLVDVVGAFFATADDDSPARMALTAAS